MIIMTLMMRILTKKMTNIDNENDIGNKDDIDEGDNSDDVLLRLRQRG